MPNKIADDKIRVSYLEWKDIHAELRIMADAERLDLSDLIRRATAEYLNKHRSDRPVKKAGKPQ